MKDVAAGSRACTITDPDRLNRIKDPTVALVLWHRHLPVDLSQAIGSTAPDRLPQLHILALVEDVGAALHAYPAPGLWHGNAARAALIADMADLAQRFARVMASDRVDIRLEATADDACWKFHRDHVAARLVTTYRGPGTQYVACADADAALADQRAYGGPVQTLPTHAVGLFKGALGPGTSGIVHRSPPIAGSGTTRLVLVLNLPGPTSPDLWSPPPRKA